MRRLILLLFFGLSVNQLVAQVGQNGITVHEDPRIEQYLAKYNNSYVTTVSEYIFRIQLVQTYNRDEAYRVQGRFRNLFPEESSFLKHDGVKFIVRAGAYDNRADAEVALSELRKNFPSSFILPPEKKKQ